MPLSDFMATIPVAEYRQFQNLVRIGELGDTIIVEGQASDNTLYLLRAGTMGVYRTIGGEQEKIATIESLAFFGEMELMAARGQRSATCRVDSEFAIIYVFHNPNIREIVKNPVWAEILITRLCHDLHLFADRIVTHEDTNAALWTTLEETRDQTALLLASLQAVHQEIGADTVIGGQDWRYLTGLNEMIQNFIETRLPSIQTHPRYSLSFALAEIIQADLLPRKIRDLILKKQRKVTA
jgi:CRP-like cAMP-binding protein